MSNIKAESSTTETEITAVAISKDDNFITKASFNKTDNTVSLWFHSINFKDNIINDNGSVKINLKEMISSDDGKVGKIDLTISKKLIPSKSNSNSRRFIILSLSLSKEENKNKEEKKNEGKKKEKKEGNDSDESDDVLDEPNDSNKTKALLLVLQLEDVLDNPEAVSMEIGYPDETKAVQSDNDSDKDVLDNPEAVPIEIDYPDEAKSLQSDNDSDKTDKTNVKAIFGVLFIDGGQLKFKESNEMFSFKDMFISAEFLADGEILAIQYKTAIQIVYVASRSWKLYHEFNDLSNQAEVAFAFNPSINISYVLLPWREKKIIDMVDISITSIKREDIISRISSWYEEKMRENIISHILSSYEENIIIKRENIISRISSISSISAKSCVGKRAITSSTGDLLAFENGLIVEKQTGLHIAEYDLPSNKKDLLFVNDDRHLLIVHSDENENSLNATLIDAYSGTKLKSAIILQKPELVKHIQLIKLINDDAVVISSHDNDIIKNCKSFFCEKSQSEKKQSEELQSKKSQLRVKGVVLPNDFNFNNKFFENLKLSDSNTDKTNDDDAIIKKDTDTNTNNNEKDASFFLFWKDGSDENVRCLVWMPPPAGEKSTIQFEYVDSTLWVYNKKFYTFLPLDSAIKDKNLPAEWMQSSCNYLNTLKKLNNSKKMSYIIINKLLDTIKQYVDHRVFNSTTAIHDLIESDGADEIVGEILKNKHYMPTGFQKKNPLTKAIEKRNISLVRKILNYCLCCYFYKMEPGFMSIVVDALPDLAIYYPKILSKLLKQCTHIKVPSEWEIVGNEKAHRNHYTDELPYRIYNSTIDYIDNPYKMIYIDEPYRYELNRHTKTKSLTSDSYYCLVSLFNLCANPLSSYSQLLFEIDNMSPFARLAFHQSREAFESPLFETIVMYKWQTNFYFALIYLSYYIIYFCLFVAAISTTTSDPIKSSKLMIASMVFGFYWGYLWIIRAYIITQTFKYKKYYGFFKFILIIIEFAALVLPFIVGFLELNHKTAPSELRSLSILFLWIFIFLQFRIFEGIGMFIAVFANIFKKIRWLLVFLVFILFASAHSLMVLLSDTLPDNEANTFTDFYQSLKNTWSMLLNDYHSLEPWTKNYLLDILIIGFSLSTAIVMFNILIALISNTYEKTRENAHTIWVMELAEIIAEIELFKWLIKQSVFKDTTNIYTIIYEASTENVDEWITKLKEKKIPILWKNEDIDERLKEVDDKLEEVNDKLKEVNDELIEINDKFKKKEEKISNEYIKMLKEMKEKIATVRKITNKTGVKSKENAI